MSCLLKSPVAIIVLGHNIKVENDLEIIKSRVLASLKIYDTLKRMLKVVKIIFSGGQRDGDLMNESEAMKHYAIYYGDDSIEKDIIIEDKSTTTCEKAVNSFKMLKNYKSFVLCTSKFHVPRAAFTFDYVFKGMKAKVCTYGVSDEELLNIVEVPKEKIALTQKLVLLEAAEKEKFDDFIKNKQQCVQKLQ